VHRSDDDKLPHERPKPEACASRDPREHQVGPIHTEELEVMRRARARLAGAEWGVGVPA